MSIASLVHRVNRLLERVNQSSSKTFYLLLEKDQPIPEAVQKLVGPDDSIVITEIPIGYFGECIPREEGF